MTHRMPALAALLLGTIVSSAHAQQSTTAREQLQETAVSEQEKADAHKAAADAGRAAKAGVEQDRQKIDAAGKTAITLAPVAKGVAVIQAGCGVGGNLPGPVGAGCKGFNIGQKAGEAVNATMEGDYPKAGVAALGVVGAAVGESPASNAIKGTVEVLTNVGEGAIAVRDQANGEQGTAQTVVDTQANLANAGKAAVEAMGGESGKVGAVADTVKAAADLPNTFKKTDENVEQTKETLKAGDERADRTEAKIQTQIDQEDSKAAQLQQNADYLKSGGPLRDEPGTAADGQKSKDFVATDPASVENGIKPIMEQKSQDTGESPVQGSPVRQGEPGHFSTEDGSITPPAATAQPSEQAAIDTRADKAIPNSGDPNFVGPPAPAEQSADDQKVDDFVNTDLSEVENGIKPVMEQQMQETSEQVSQSGISQSSNEAASERENAQSEDNDSASEEGQKTYSSLNAMYGAGASGAVSASKSTSGASPSATTGHAAPTYDNGVCSHFRYVGC